MNIPVTKPFLPAYEEYRRYLEGIWSRGWLTNNGPLVNELELRLKDALGVDHLLYVSNGTIALQLGIRALDLKGEVLTTPFSYVATTSSLVWEGCMPVMVDIDPRTLNIDPDCIEEKITEQTTGIVATHVFGNPCAVERIEAIARRHGLKVIYDAAHGFGTMLGDRSLLDYGDLSTCSFHATKLFHTIEGGCVIARSPDVLKRVAELRNFGHVSATEFGGVGINGKNSEFHAAMGLANLPHFSEIVQRRRHLYLRYRDQLDGLPGFSFQAISPDTIYNHSYFPVVLPSEKLLLDLVDSLNLNNIFPRRYFYPSLSKLSYVGRQDTPVADSIAPRSLCLPMYHDLSIEEVDMICRLIKRGVRYG